MTDYEKFASIIQALEEYGHAQTAIVYARELQETFAPITTHVEPEIQPDCGTPTLDASRKYFNKLAMDTGCQLQ